MTQKEMTSSLWLSGILFITLLFNWVISIALCVRDDNFTSLLIAGSSYTIPCIAESVKFLLDDVRKMNYGLVKFIIIGIIIVEIIFSTITIYGIIVGPSIPIIWATAISMLIYAIKNFVFFIYYYLCLNKKK